MPGGGNAGGTFYFAGSHGPGGLALFDENDTVRNDNGAYLSRLLAFLTAGGFTSVTLLLGMRGGAEPSPETARAIAWLVAYGTGLPTHVATTSSVVQDGVPHLLEAADGRATYFVTVHPSGLRVQRPPRFATPAGNIPYPAPEHMIAADDDD
ncbi:hypothetical protein STPH1_7218 [Streptomyces sp. OM5714]|nr:hypothetical protein STPH1_7218 [Streptomyces sp. OM5714]